MKEKSAKKPTKTSSTTSKSLTIEEMKDLVLFMKSSGVLQFTAGELAVEFDPEAVAGVPSFKDETPEDRKTRLLNEFKQINIDKRIDEEWSV